jgi:hypothetical protein
MDKSTCAPLKLHDCAQVAIATGRWAGTVRELREQLATVEEASLYHHFWGRLLLPQFDEPEYNNDFASWASHSLHDKALAERLSAVNPTTFGSMEDVRQELIDIVETRLDESELLAWRQADYGFYFMRAQMVVFNTSSHVERPEDLREAMEHVSEGTIFYHFIDARRRTEARRDDISLWLEGCGERYQDLAGALHSIDPYFSSLYGLRQRLINTVEQHLQGELYGSAPGL